MKKITFLLAFVLSASFIFAQDDGEKTLVKTLDPEGASEILFDLKHEKIDAKPWDSKGLRLQFEIHANFPEAIMAQLVKAGRYRIEGTLEGDVFTIYAPNLEKHVSIGGKDLVEKIYLRVQTPGYYQLDGAKLSKKLSEETIASYTARGQQAQLKEMRKIKQSIDVEIKLVGTDAEPIAEDKKSEVSEKLSKGRNSNKGRKHGIADEAASMSRGKGSPAASGAPMSPQQLKAQYGEILIDGIEFEFE